MDKIIAVRGATTIEHDDAQQIIEASTELIKNLVEKNGIGKSSYCVSIIISITKDIKSYYPAKAIRESGLIDAPLFSCLEPDINGALPLCIRVMLTLVSNDNAKANHVYLNGAKALRPDLINE